MNNKTVSGFIWRLLERFGAQGVTFVVSIIIARLVEPAAYGTVAIVNVIISFLNIFIEGGLGTALIQKKDVDDLDYCSVFYFNLLVCIFLYIVLYIIASPIAHFYSNDCLILVIRLLGLTLIISGFRIVQGVYVSRNMIFKKYFFATIIGTVISAIVGILMAYEGYGIWALVAQVLVNNVIDTIVLWYTVKWMPKLFFSFKRLKILFSFSWKIMLSSLLGAIYGQLSQLIIGKKYSTSDLAYYNKGNHFPEATTSSILVSIDSVLLPTMSKEQDNIDNVKNITRRSIKVSSYILLPMMIGLAACADNVVKTLYTEKWSEMIPYLRIFCVTYAFYPIHSANINAIVALGKSNTFLKLEILKKIVEISALLISVKYGVYAMAISTIVTSIISQIINTYPNKKLMNYNYIDQLKDIIPSLVLSIVMGVIVYSINFVGLNSISTLILQIIVGLLIYIGLSIITKNDNYIYCCKTFKSLIGKKIMNN